MKPKNETFTDPRDGKTYRTVKIGNLVWMAENLNFEAEGSKNYLTWMGNHSASEAKNSRCYDDDPANGEKYGRLYNWYSAKEVSPEGWHLPIKEEWEHLIRFAGGEEAAGKNLKSRSGWNKDGNGTDKFGFSALPGGNVNSNDGKSGNGPFENLGNQGLWWSSTEYKYNPRRAYTQFLSSRSNEAHSQYQDKLYFLSIRCVQNHDEWPLSDDDYVGLVADD